MSNTTIFTPEETALLLEAARIALSDADIFSQIAEETDTADQVMCNLREKMHFALNDSSSNEIQLNTREDGEGLILEGQSATDYLLADNATNVWIRVDSTIINIARREYVEGTFAVAEIFAAGSECEDHDIIAECSAAIKEQP